MPEANSMPESEFSRATFAMRDNSAPALAFIYSPLHVTSEKSLPIQKTQSSAVIGILNSIQTLETTLSDKIAKVIDEKLEGMDEVVVELIRCKTDNETLKQKIIDLNKEIYQLKNDLNSYKPIGLGLYKRKERHAWE